MKKVGKVLSISIFIVLLVLMIGYYIASGIERFGIDFLLVTCLDCMILWIMWVIISISKKLKSILKSKKKNESYELGTKKRLDGIQPYGFNKIEFFGDDNKWIGELKMGKKLRFTGKADKSAKIFIREVINEWEYVEIFKKNKKKEMLLKDGGKI